MAARQVRVTRPLVATATSVRARFPQKAAAAKCAYHSLSGTCIHAPNCAVQQDMTFRLQPTVRNVFFLAVAVTLSACTGFETSEKSGTLSGQPSVPVSPQPASLESYFELLDLMAPGDVVRQSAKLAATQTNAQAEPHGRQPTALCPRPGRGRSLAQQPGRGAAPDHRTARRPERPERPGGLAGQRVPA